MFMTIVFIALGLLLTITSVAYSAKSKTQEVPMSKGRLTAMLVLGIIILCLALVRVALYFFIL